MESRPRLFTLIPAAGNGQRFRDAGYEVAKPFLPVEGTTPMFEVVGDTAPAGSRVVLGVQQTDLPDRPISRSYWSWVPFHRYTDGQAETVEAMAMLLPSDAEVLVINCDQITSYPLPSFVDGCRAAGANAGVLTFKGQGNTAYSYVAGKPWVQMAVEKVPISEDAVAGFYWFKSARLLLHAIRSHREHNKSPELYLTPCLNYIRDVLAVPLNEHTLTSWGTPAEYEKNRRK